jgi:hydroxyacylglutathione hydrolase
MGVNIYPIQLGFDHCYLIQDKGVIMIDGGTPKKAKAFKKAMEKIPIRPDEIQLMVITHGHYDHAGSAGDIKEVTGARIALHRLDKDWLEKGLVVMPGSVTTWGHIMLVMLKIFSPWLRLPATGVDVVLGDRGLSLVEYGIGGKVIHTPGHTPGSVSVLLETGDAFVGCLAHSKLPLRLRPGLPVFAEDVQAVRESWKLLLDQGARTIYPAHGKPFSADIIRKALS